MDARKSNIWTNQNQIEIMRFASKATMNARQFAERGGEAYAYVLTDFHRGYQRACRDRDSTILANKRDLVELIQIPIPLSAFGLATAAAIVS
jgi:hypothetical protein